MKWFSKFLAVLALILLPLQAHATNRTAWTSGNGQGLSSWSSAATAFLSSDLTSLASGSSVLSGATAIANGTNLDIYADISVEITISSGTPTAGGYIAVYAAILQEDGTTYGDGQLTASSQTAYVPVYVPICTIPLRNTAMTLMAGSCTGVILPPQTFKFVVLNNSGLAFSSTAANNVVSFKTYNQNLNN